MFSFDVFYSSTISSWMATNCAPLFHMKHGACTKRKFKNGWKFHNDKKETWNCVFIKFCSNQVAIDVESNCKRSLISNVKDISPVNLILVKTSNISRLRLKLVVVWSGTVSMKLARGHALTRCLILTQFIIASKLHRAHCDETSRYQHRW